MNATLNPLFQQILATTIGEGQTFMVNKSEFFKLCEDDRRAKELQEGSEE